MTVAVAVPSLGIGGCEMYAADLARELQRTAKTVLLCHGSIEPALRRLADAVEVCGVAGEEGHRSFSDSMAAYLGERRPQALVVVIPLPVDEAGTTPDPIALLEAADALGIPTTAVFQLCHKAFEATPAARLAAGRLTRHQRWVTVSHDNRRHLAETFGVPADRLTVIPNGVDLPPDVRRRSGPGLRSDLGLDGQAALLLTVGRLVRSKRHADAIDALSQLPGDAHLAVAGEGPEYGALLDRADAVGVSDRVSLLGHRDDVGALLHEADAFVFPSIAEGASFALLEAMAAGLPVVTSACGSNAEIVRNGVDGYVHRPLSPDDLAEKLRLLLTDSSRCRAFGQAARARVERHYARETMMGDTIRLVLGTGDGREAS